MKRKEKRKKGTSVVIFFFCFVFIYSFLRVDFERLSSKPTTAFSCTPNAAVRSRWVIRVRIFFGNLPVESTLWKNAKICVPLVQSAVGEIRYDAQIWWVFCDSCDKTWFEKQFPSWVLEIAFQWANMYESRLFQRLISRAFRCLIYSNIGSINSLNLN